MTDEQTVERVARSLNGYAPGGYMNKCHNCDDEFIGDKRAITCFYCAIAAMPHLESIDLLNEEIVHLRVELDAVPGWQDTTNKPPSKRRVWVFVPQIAKRDLHYRDPLACCRIGWYEAELDEWRIEASPSKWNVTRWTDLPPPPEDET